MKKIIVAFVFLSSLIGHCQCSPFMGIGNVQFLDNLGNPLTNGVLYSYQAGTSTQQATFTSSTCGTPNVNPITFGSGGRVPIWLTSNAFYKFVLCSQNDGPACSAGDVLFSVDQVPGGATGGSSGGSPFIGIFISGSATPSTAGAVRYASGDLECWRNAANTGNFCLSKDSNDLLTWAGGSLKFPESSAPSCVVGYDIVYADSFTHRLSQCNNGAGSPDILLGAATADTETNKTLIRPVIGGGIPNNTAFQSFVITSCITPSGANAGCNNSYAPSVAFFDASWNIVCSLDTQVSGGSVLLIGCAPTGPNSFTVAIQNIGANTAASQWTIGVIAVHP